MRTLPACLVTGLALCSFAGCGDADSTADPSADDRRAAGRAVSGYLDMLEHADGERGCAYLTATMQRQLVDATASSSCPAAFRKIARADPDAETVFRQAKVTAVDVNGDRATATISSSMPSAETTRVTLERSTDGWKLADLAGDAGERQDVVAACVQNALAAYDNGDADPYWLRQGRADLSRFAELVCRRTARRHPDGELTDAETERIAGAVLRAMVRRGEVPAP